MHVTFFSHYFPPEGNAPAMRTHNNCKRWVEQGHRVTVITGVPSVPTGVVYEGYKNKLFQRENIDGIEVIRVWTYLAANKGTMLRIVNFISYLISTVLVSLFLKRPDIIIATSPQFFCGWAGLIAGKLLRRPFILEIRDIWPDSIIAVGAMKNQSIIRLLEIMENRLYSWSESIVTVGEGYQKELIGKGVESKKISIIPNGLDHEQFSPREPDQSMIEKYNLQSKFVCSYVGTIGMACGLDVVIRAGEILREKGNENIVFLLVGEGAFRNNLQSEAERLELKNVIFTGRLDKQLIPNILSITDACLVHLKRQALFRTVMPTKIFEAAGMEKPIILGVEGYAAKLVQEAHAGILIEPENENQLVSAVENLAGDLRLCRSYGQDGRTYFIRHFDRDRLASDYLTLLTEHIKNKTRL